MKKILILILLIIPFVGFTQHRPTSGNASTLLGLDTGDFVRTTPDLKIISEGTDGQLLKYNADGTISPTDDLGATGFTDIQFKSISEVLYITSIDTTIRSHDHDHIKYQLADQYLLDNKVPVVYNIPVDGVTSTELTWIGEQRVEAAAQTGDYATDFATNNQHCAINVLSLTGSGVVTFTGVSNSESTGLPTAGVTETITVDATGRYQTDKKWIEITNIDIPAGITVISYDIGVLGYVDMFNTNFKIHSIRIDMRSSGVNSDIAIKILKVQDDGDKKLSIVEIEHLGVDASTNSVVDELRTGGDDRSYTTSSSLWESGDNYSLKQSDYCTFFTNDENIIEGISKAEGFIIQLEGVSGGTINNVSMFNLLMIIEYY